MRLAFSAAWKYLQSSESVSEPGLREKLACKIIELARDVSPDVDVLRDAALRSLGRMYDGSHCRSPAKIHGVSCSRGESKP
jgi:hypothetical protein